MNLGIFALNPSSLMSLYISKRSSSKNNYAYCMLSKDFQLYVS